VRRGVAPGRAREASGGSAMRPYERVTAAGQGAAHSLLRQ
jgi:hypothetical protein